MKSQLDGVKGGPYAGDKAQQVKDVTVFLLDDHELVRRGLRELLETEGCVIVGETGSAEEATRRIPALSPDVSILDVRLPDGTGIEVCRNVCSINPSLSCVILTSYDDRQAVRGAVLAGASGYILKEILGSDLVGKVLRAAAGESLFEPGMKERIIAGLHDIPEEDARLARLTTQERKILTLIGKGMSNREIAGELFLAEKTIKNHVSSILAKLGFQRRTQAAVYISTSVEPLPS
ncbi:response regulator transcription factor [Arthrobacter sp. SX1312]|uniref:response regulator n=1 Tax=Arthrobacter sp. SX1312 TaxID=2058896 RepID=UPI000CE40879|nr:response regulator transcription factor [Arthrobacter sp. SX1312]